MLPSRGQQTYHSSVHPWWWCCVTTIGQLSGDKGKRHLSWSRRRSITSARWSFRTQQSIKIKPLIMTILLAIKILMWQRIYSSSTPSPPTSTYHDPTFLCFSFFLILLSLSTSSIVIGVRHICCNQKHNIWHLLKNTWITLETYFSCSLIVRFRCCITKR